MKVDHNLESEIVERMSSKLQSQREREKLSERAKTTERLSGREWIQARLERGRYGLCGSHYHLECEKCGSTKCVGETGYEKYKKTKQVCDCERDTTEHRVVPFDNFGQHVGFP